MQHVFRTSVLILTVGLMAAVGTIALSPQQAHAQAGVAGCGGGAAVGAGAAAASSALTVPTFDLPSMTNTQKECLYDGLIVLIRETLIEAVVSSIVNWINSGFQGGPAFITDYQGFLRNVSDQVAGEFINSSELGFLCSPNDIRIALAINYYSSYSEQNACTLTDVVENTESFLRGNFSEGGWPGWLELTARPTNNVYGSFVSARAELNSRANAARERESAQLEWGQGFKGFETCRTYESAANPSDTGAQPGQTRSREECVTGTPGTVINQQLNWSLSSGQRQYELADEIDEIVGALMGQLAQQVLTGAGGLLGSSGGSSYSSYDASGNTYLDRLRGNLQDRTSQTAQNTQETLSIYYDSPRQLEERYAEERQETLEAVRAARRAVEDVRSCYAAHLEQDQQQSSYLSVSQAETARQRMAAASSTLTTSVLPVQEEVSGDIQEAQENIGAIEQVLDELGGDIDAVTDAEGLQQLTDRYLAIEERMPAGIELHDPEDLQNAIQANQDIEQFTDNTTVEDMKRIRSSYQQKLSTCQDFPQSGTQAGQDSGPPDGGGFDGGSDSDGDTGDAGGSVGGSEGAGVGGTGPSGSSSF